MNQDEFQFLLSNPTQIEGIILSKLIENFKSALNRSNTYIQSLVNLITSSSFNEQDLYSIAFLTVLKELNVRVGDYSNLGSYLQNHKKYSISISSETDMSAISYFDGISNIILSFSPVSQRQQQTIEIPSKSRIFTGKTTTNRKEDFKKRVNTDEKRKNRSDKQGEQEKEKRKNLFTKLRLEPG